MTEVPSLESLRTLLPPYLSGETAAKLFSELGKLPDLDPFFSLGEVDWDLVKQGDGWHGLTAFVFATGERRVRKGVILSNTCDVSTSNPRRTEPNVVFCPLVSVSRFRDRLLANGCARDEVEGYLQALRSQRITNLMHFPAQPTSDDEMLIIFDDVRSQPLESFLSAERAGLFRLTQAAFYLLLMKLSIHFCRVGEGVARG